ncbi:MAG TPA: adenosylcobinamide-phosphate synthase CbiB [Thermodesulfovibrionales bacterium]|nr:adenosylcobinamide-phosphate synthase CbiB [Thermodesulfovibrionales bacterium]
MTGLFEPSALPLQLSVLLLAFLLDLAIGDPRWLPHPVRIIGKGIAGIETLMRRHLRSPLHERAGGVLLVILVVIPVFAVSLLIERTAFSVMRPFTATPLSVLGLIVLVYLTSTTIAVRELIGSAKTVIDSVRVKDIDGAKKNLGMIVGRDTHDLSEKAILKASMETVAENLSDGVVAPLFYLALGGLPLAMVYKAINTLDSMVGYRNERYLNFGRAAARLDDIANFIPARITGILIVISSFLISRSLFTFQFSLKTLLRDGRNHLSPNSGVPEAAMAGALGIRMGGPSTYGGMVVEKPYIGDARTADSTEDYLAASGRALAIARVTSALGVLCAAVMLSARMSL